MTIKDAFKEFKNNGDAYIVNEELELSIRHPEMYGGYKLSGPPKGFNGSYFYVHVNEKTQRLYDVCLNYVSGPNVRIHMYMTESDICKMYRNEHCFTVKIFTRVGA